MSKSLKKNALLNVFRNITRLLFPLIIFPYVSRILMPEGIGKVNFANSIISYFSIIAMLGINSYGVREAAKIRDDKEALSKFTKEMFIINIISTIVAYILLFLSLVFVKKFENYRILLIVTSSTLLLNTLGFEWLFLALEDYFYVTVRTIVFQVVSLILVFFMVRKPEDVLNYALVSVISNAGANICNIFSVRRFLNFRVREKLEFRKHLQPVFVLFFSSIAIIIFSMLDTSMVGFLRDDIEVGYYSAATKIVRMIRDLFPAISAVLCSRVSIYYAQNNFEKIKDVSKKILDLFYAFSIPICMGLILLMEPVVLLMCGKEFLPAVSVGQVMAPLVILSSVSGYLSGCILISFGREKIYMFIEMGAALLDVVLNFVFIPKYGALGAAIATMITEAAMFIIFHYFTRDVLIGVKIIKNLLEYIFAALVMGGLILVELHFLKTDYIFTLLICFVSGVVTYGGLLLLMRNSFVLEMERFAVKKLKVNR